MSRLFALAAFTIAPMRALRHTLPVNPLVYRRKPSSFISITNSMVCCHIHRLEIPLILAISERNCYSKFVRAWTVVDKSRADFFEWIRWPSRKDMCWCFIAVKMTSSTPLPNTWKQLSRKWAGSCKFCGACATASRVITDESDVYRMIAKNAGYYAYRWRTTYELQAFRFEALSTASIKLSDHTFVLLIICLSYNCSVSQLTIPCTRVSQTLLLSTAIFTVSSFSS